MILIWNSYSVIFSFLCAEALMRLCRHSVFIWTGSERIQIHNYVYPARVDKIDNPRKKPIKLNLPLLLTWEPCAMLYNTTLKLRIHFTSTTHNHHKRSRWIVKTQLRLIWWEQSVQCTSDLKFQLVIFAYHCYISIGPDEQFFNVNFCNHFLIHQFKHVCVLQRNVSLRRFFWVHTTYVLAGI